ncbi:MAG: hypothetical protein ABR907_15845, partial [Terracidiphilus sp.]
PGHPNTRVQSLSRIGRRIPDSATQAKSAKITPPYRFLRRAVIITSGYNVKNAQNSREVMLAGRTTTNCVGLCMTRMLKPMIGNIGDEKSTSILSLGYNL